VPRDVMLGFPHRGDVRTEFMMGVLAAVCAPASRIATVLPVASGPVLAEARCQLAARLLSTDVEWLWMVDTDIVFTPATLPALLDLADPGLAPVVGALCMIRPDPDGPARPSLYEAGLGEDGRPGFGLLPGWPPGVLLRVDGTGTGCLLIHRSVFEKIPDLPFAYMTVGGRIFGEDLSFCVRCDQAGIPVHVATGVQVGHIKSTVLGQASP
jgi:GT2 family glycosyltransferase